MILPMGRHGPAFLAYPNFQAFLGWNSAYVYSTTVAYFATRLAGAPAFDHAGAKTVVPLSTPQMMELQRLLLKQGYKASARSTASSAPAPAPRSRRRRSRLGLPADSYPTVELIERLGGGRIGDVKP